MTTEKHDPWALLREAKWYLTVAKKTLTLAGTEDVLARIDAALAGRAEVPAQDSATGFVEPKDSDWTLLSNHANIIVALLPNDEMLSIRPETDKYGTLWAWSYGGLVKTEAEARRAATAAAKGMK
jgi:hypothetical protein